MSFDAIRWALAQPVKKSSTKFVLVAMADCVNEDANMLCWPSCRHLSEITGQDVKTVEAGLARLRELGYIVDTNQRRGKTGQVIVYLLKTPENGGVKAARFQRDDDDQETVNTPELGGVDTAGKTPVFPRKTPVFPAQDPQISGLTPPKTGDGTSNGTNKGTKRGEAQAPSIPGVPDDLIADWLKVRKAKNAGPITATVIAGLQREAAKAGLSVADAVTFCCEAGWQGFNAGWYGERAAKASRPVNGTGKHAAAAAGIFGTTQPQGVVIDV